MLIYGLDLRKVVICMKPNNIKKEELQKVFEYRNGGVWRKEYIDKLNRVCKSTLVRSTANSAGYCLVRFKGQGVYLHRIVWILNYGDIPENTYVDHINGNKIDNRLENLRLVSHRVNHWNRKKHREGKLPGCYFDNTRKMYHAQVWLNNRLKFLGYYPTELEAHNAYIKFLKENGID